MPLQHNDILATKFVHSDGNDATNRPRIQWTLALAIFIIKQQGTQKGEAGWGDKNSRDRCSYQLFWHVPNVLNNGSHMRYSLLDFDIKSKDFHLFKCPKLSILWLVISLRRKSCMLHLSQNLSWRWRSANFKYVITPRKGFFILIATRERERESVCVCLCTSIVLSNFQLSTIKHNDILATKFTHSSGNNVTNHV